MISAPCNALHIMCAFYKRIPKTHRYELLNAARHSVGLRAEIVVLNCEHFVVGLELLVFDCELVVGLGKIGELHREVGELLGCGTVLSMYGGNVALKL